MVRSSLLDTSVPHRISEISSNDFPLQFHQSIKWRASSYSALSGSWLSLENFEPPAVVGSVNDMGLPLLLLFAYTESYMHLLHML